MNKCDPTSNHTKSDRTQREADNLAELMRCDLQIVRKAYR